MSQIGEGVTSVQVGDHVIPRYTPQNVANVSSALSGKTNLCQKIRETQGKGLMPDGTTRFYKDGQPYLTITWVVQHSLNTRYLPEISLAKVR